MRGAMEKRQRQSQYLARDRQPHVCNVAKWFPKNRYRTKRKYFKFNNYDSMYIFNCKCRSISMNAPWPNGSPNKDTDTDTKENYSKFNNLVR